MPKYKITFKPSVDPITFEFDTNDFEDMMGETEEEIAENIADVDYIHDWLVDAIGEDLRIVQDSFSIEDSIQVQPGTLRVEPIK
jgi:hypothetical protein